MQEHDSASSADSLRNNAGLIGAGEYVKGARLVANSDCIGCHKINAQSVGPSYDSVAMRYEFNEGNVENLAHKIINGGQGVWTNKTAMPAHTSISIEDANEMAKYILSLRDKQ